MQEASDDSISVVHECILDELIILVLFFSCQTKPRYNWTLEQRIPLVVSLCSTTPFMIYAWNISTDWLVLITFPSKPHLSKRKKVKKEDLCGGLSRSN